MKINPIKYSKTSNNTEWFYKVFFEEKDTKKVNRFDIKAKK